MGNTSLVFEISQTLGFSFNLFYKALDYICLLGKYIIAIIILMRLNEFRIIYSQESLPGIVKKYPSILELTIMHYLFIGG